MTASVLAFCLVSASPGAELYAQVARVSGSVGSAPVGTGAGAVQAGASAGQPGAPLLLNVSLTASPLSLPAGLAPAPLSPLEAPARGLELAPTASLAALPTVPTQTAENLPGLPQESAPAMAAQPTPAAVAIAGLSPGAPEERGLATGPSGKQTRVRESKVRRSFELLRKLFDSRGDPGESGVAVSGGEKTLPSAILKYNADSPRGPPGQDAEDQPPVPPDRNAGGAGGGGRGWFGLGKTAAFYLVAIMVGQVGIEAIAAATPELSETQFGHFTMGAWLTIMLSFGDSIGNSLSPMIMKRFGKSKTLRGADAALVVWVSVLSGLLAAGQMTLPLMLFFYLFYGVFQGVSTTAEFSIAPALVGQSQDRLERYWSWRQILIEVVAIVVPIVTGVVVHAYGFLPAMIAFPVAFAIAIAIMTFTLKIPNETLDQSRKAPTLREIWHGMWHGWGVVRKSPLLWTVFTAYSMVQMLNPFLYNIIAIGFALGVVGGAGGATAVYGMITGLYSLGGLIAGVAIMTQQRNLKRAGLSETERNEALRKSMLRWMVFGALALVAFTTFLAPLPMLGAVVSLPGWLSWLGSLTLPALAMIPFGVFQVGARVKLRSYFQSKVDEKDLDDATGFLEAGSLIISSIGLVVLIFLFQSLSGLTPFVVFIAGLVPVAALILTLMGRIAYLSRKP